MNSPMNCIALPNDYTDDDDILTCTRCDASPDPIFYLDPDNLLEGDDYIADDDALRCADHIFA